VFGDGEQRRDFVYVGDVVDALLAAVGRSGGPFNIGTGVATSINGLHAACRSVSGIDRPPRHEAARLGDVLQSVVDPARAGRELGWSARTSLEEGLARTWAWTEEAALA
jgi:nucleoside-diphosphate-sugar epimerase